MTYFFRQDFEVCMPWTLYSPMRAWDSIHDGSIVKRKTDAGRSHGNDNMPNVARPDYSLYISLFIFAVMK